MNYQFSAELLSLVLLIIVFIHALPRMGNQESNQQLFVNGLIFIGLSSLFNLLTLFTDAATTLLPLWVHYLSNTAYYVITIAMANFLALYAFEKILFHIVNPKPLQVSKHIIAALNVIVGICMLANLHHPIVFYFDANRVYTHGPLWMIGHLEIGLIILMSLYYFVRYYSYMDKSAKQVFSLGVPVLGSLITAQILYPTLLLNGTIATYTAIIFYLNFQSQPVQVDPLTKLPNRMSFINDLRATIQTKKSFEVIWFCLNDFGQLNRTHGFTIGDEVLYRISIWLIKHFPTAHIYRIAPGTFALVFEQIDEKKRTRNIDIVQNQFSRHWYLENHDCIVNTFIVETYQPENHSLAVTQVVEGLEHAEIVAKREGLSFICYDDKLEKVIQRRKYVYDLLLDAVDKKKFVVYLQPIWSNLRHGYYSAEALVRLPLEDGQFLSPEEFIPVAENSGLMERINDQIVAQICNFLNVNHDLNLDYISFNLSSSQLQSRTFADDLRNTLRKQRINPAQFALEITERMLISSNRTVLNNLDQLKEMGFVMLLDDFGTGYSNFASVLHLPIDFVKLDKSLIWGKENEDNHYLTVSSLTRLFHNSGKKVVAEGIETEAQANALKDLQIDGFQGYHYSRPLPMEQFKVFLLEHRQQEKSA